MSDTIDPIELNMRVASRAHVGDTHILLVHYLSALSMVIPGQGFSVYSVGGSGKGKTHASKAVFDLFNDDLKLPMSTNSSTALNYWFNEAMNPAILFWSEMTLDPKDEKSMGIMRSLLDNSKNFHLVSEKNEKGKWVAKKVLLPQNCPCWFNSVAPIRDSDGQMLNRVLLVNPNESKEQDEKVHSFNYERLFHQKNTKDPELAIARQVNGKIINAGPREVFIPIPEQDFIFPNKSNRRNLPKLATMIKSVVVARQDNRLYIPEEEPNTRPPILLAEPEDVELALWAYNQIADTNNAQVSQGALEILELVPTSIDGSKDSIGKTALSDLSGKKADRVSRLCKELVLAGMIEWKREADRSFVYWRTSRHRGFSSACRVEWSNITAKSVFGQLEAFSASRYGNMEGMAEYLQRWDVANHSPYFPISTPRWLNDLLSANGITITDSISARHDKTNHAEMPTSSTEDEIPSEEVAIIK